MLVDTHCHLNKEDYENVDEVIKNMNGIMIASGCSEKSNKEVMELIDKYPNVYGAIGIHPEDIDYMTEESLKFIEENLNNPAHRSGGFEVFGRSHSLCHLCDM